MPVRPAFSVTSANVPSGVLAVQAVPELAVGLVGQLAGRHRVVDLRAVREEDVQPAVVVVVEQGHAAAHGLHQVLVRRGGVLVREVDAGRLGDVGELHIRSGRCADRAGAAERRTPATRRHAHVADRPHRRLYPNRRLLDDALRFLDHEEVIGGQVAEASPSRRRARRARRCPPWRRGPVRSGGGGRSANSSSSRSSPRRSGCDRRW